MRAAAVLLGVSTTFDPEVLGRAPPFDLPDELFAPAHNNLSVAFDHAPQVEWPKWAGFINRAGNAADRPAWLTKWHEANAAALAWRALGVFLTPDKPTAHVRDWTGAEGAPRAAHTIILRRPAPAGAEPTSDPIKKDDFSDLCATIPNDPAGLSCATELSVHLNERKLPVLAYYLAARLWSEYRHATWLGKVLAADPLCALADKPDEVQKTATHLAKVGNLFGCPGPISWGLAALWDHVPSDRQDQLRAEVAKYLGQPLATILLDTHTTEARASTAWDAARVAATLSPARLDRAVKHRTWDRGVSEPLSKNVIVPALRGIRRAALPGELLPFVAALYQNVRAPYPTKLTADELSAAESLTVQLANAQPDTTPADPTGADQFPAVFAFAKWFRAPPVVPHELFLGKLRETVHSASAAEKWRASLDAAGWTGQPLWRLPGGLHTVDALNNDEEALLADLKDAEYLRFVLTHGAPVSPLLMMKVTAAALEVLPTPAATVQDALRLLGIASQFVRYEVFKFAWKMLLATARPTWEQATVYSSGWSLTPTTAPTRTAVRDWGERLIAPREKPPGFEEQWQGTWAEVACRALMALEGESRERLVVTLRTLDTPLPNSIAWARLK